MTLHRAVRLLPLTFTLALTGCNDEPTCAALGEFSGGYQGSIAWSLEGQGSCGAANVTIEPNSSGLAFVDTSTGISQNLYILPATTGPVVGIYAARVLFVLPTNIWDSGSGNCTVEITEFSIEDWSRTDFVNIHGVVICEGGLLSASPESQDVTFPAIEFDGHIHDEKLDYDFI